MDTIKLALRKLSSRDISFQKIKAHEVGTPSSYAFFDKVPLGEILKAAVWNQSSTFAKCLNKQLISILWAQLLLPKKWWGIRKIEPLSPRED